MHTHWQKGLEIVLSTLPPAPGCDRCGHLAATSHYLLMYLFIYSHLVLKDLRQLTEIQPHKRGSREGDLVGWKMPGSEAGGLGFKSYSLLIFDVESLHLWASAPSPVSRGSDARLVQWVVNGMKCQKRQGGGAGTQHLGGTDSTWELWHQGEKRKGERLG